MNEGGEGKEYGIILDGKGKKGISEEVTLRQKYLNEVRR